jgi:hypothetical protein
LLGVIGKLKSNWKWLYHHQKKFTMKDWIKRFVEGNLKLKTISFSDWRAWSGNCPNLGSKYFRNKVVFIDHVYCNAHLNFHEA